MHAKKLVLSQVSFYAKQKLKRRQVQAMKLVHFPRVWPLSVCWSRRKGEQICWSTNIKLIDDIQTQQRWRYKESCSSSSLSEAQGFLQSIYPGAGRVGDNNYTWDSEEKKKKQVTTESHSASETRLPTNSVVHSHGSNEDIPKETRNRDSFDKCSLKSAQTKLTSDEYHSWSALFFRRKRRGKTSTFSAFSASVSRL